MKELFLQWFPTFKFSANMYYMVGMGIKYNKHDDTLIDKVKVTGGLENKAGSLCKVVSEWLPVGISENKIIMEFLKEVVMFVQGERAQGKLTYRLYRHYISRSRKLCYGIMHAHIIRHMLS